MAEKSFEPTRIGPWLVEKKIGAGGFGAVYAVRHADRPEIVRALKWTALPDEETLARMRREAELLARVQHPAVVRIFEVGQHGQGAYLIMELVAGRSLRSVVDEAPEGLELDRAFALMRGIAEALGAAHALGITHRDLKPENVLVDEHGLPRVIDFGLALAGDVERLTKTGASMGTLAYMAPEQLDARREAMGPPTDVYALGAIFYELLTGRPLFAGTHGMIVKKIASGEYEPATRVRAGLPEGTDAFLARCFDHHPRNRYPDARALALALGSLRSGALAREGRAARRRRAALLGGAFVLVAALGVAGYVGFTRQWERADDELAQLESEVAALPLERAKTELVSPLARRSARLLASRWLRTDLHEKDLKSLSERLHRLELAATARSGDAAQAPTAAVELLLLGDSAAIACGWPVFADSLPKAPEERVKQLDAVLAKASSRAASGVRHLCVRALLDAASRIETPLARADALKHAGASPEEYAGESRAWVSTALEKASSRVSALAYGEALLAHYPALPGMDASRRQLKSSIAAVSLALATELAPSDGAGAIQARVRAYELDPAAPAPAWYAGWLEKVAFDDKLAHQLAGDVDAKANELQTTAFRELVAEDACWGLAGPERVPLRVSPRFQARPGADANEVHFLEALTIFASHPYPLLENNNAPEGAGAQWTNVPERYQDLARCLVRRALEVRPPMPPLGRQTPAIRAFELESRLLGELCPGKGPNAWDEKSWTANDRTVEKELFPEIEALQQTAVDEARTAAESRPGDPFVARSYQLARLRRAAGLELWGWFFMPVLGTAPGETLTPSPGQIAARVCDKLATALAIDLEAHAPDYRLLEVQRLMAWAAAAKGDLEGGLKIVDDAVGSELGARIARDPVADLIAGTELFLLHQRAALIALEFTPPRLDRAVAERAACQALLERDFMVADELSHYQEQVKDLDDQIRRARPR